ncbi:beta-ketoacyl-[acyl-carrier-protein] synthase family protein [Clostridium beijerinckii]|uniref:3-oxoacyl-[acyl-carrier-protein] synthase 2 n=1 Tax=Clostridium beijerinckii TaxID=1520 RepID=A0A1S8SK29_CLOBE|nr:beta-ketoacyl synthase N-terminal-like domain-containing protein [Clostridium beijerinckii]NRY61544.1 3-oxoacyl-(acyl-carrier-protein) synthase [Clostridium beijerinckii]OOM65861.1 3-oxoacyl-[acyl-carrier-protein] synthase 2 [Clostridium beijerinckii]
MLRKVVITGIGVVSPAGIGKNNFWDTISKGKCCIKNITRFDTTDVPIKVAGEISDFAVTDFMSKRWIRKSDRFAHLAVAATKLAIEDAKLNLEVEDRERIGISIGNNVGGWEFGEQGLYALYKEGENMVSPYQASAWFPAAAQGLVSIIYDIKGISKTTVADRASGMMALGLAMRMISSGQADVMVAGGTEAPIAPYAMLCYYSSGSLSEESDPKKAYTPFNKNSNGIALGEGSGIVILEEYEHAVKRGAHIYAELAGYAAYTDSNLEDFELCEGLSKSMSKALERGKVSPSEINYICAEGSGSERDFKLENNSIKKIFGENSQCIPISVPKSTYGHLYGASSPVDLVSTIMAMENGMVPPTINFTSPADGCDLNYIANKPIKCEIRNALINSRGQDGVNASLLVKKFR